MFLEAHGIKLGANCGGVGNITFDGLLYESGLDPLLTIEERWPGFLFGLRLKDCNIADSRVPAIKISLQSLRSQPGQLRDKWRCTYDGTPDRRSGYLVADSWTGGFRK